ncbi:MAG TPA: rhomboid family intramembrane serine protease [Candidatus Limnocylindrales bacterium]
MSGIWIAGNAVVVFTSLVIVYLLYYLRVPAAGRRWPWVSATIIAVTAALTGLQFAYPGLLDALRRDPDGLLDGEVWRIVTPIFVQSDGATQAALNAFLALAFLPLVERLYGNGLWLVYFGPGVVYQIVNFTLFPDHGAGSSSAIFGAMGAMHAYVLRRRVQVGKPFMVVSAVPVAAAVVLAIFRDGHGWGLLAGALVALLLLRSRRAMAGRPAQPEPQPLEG